MLWGLFVPVQYLQSNLAAGSIMATAAAIVPTTFIAAAALFGRRGRSASAAIVRALQVGSIPVIAILTIGYAITLCTMARADMQDVAKIKMQQTWEGSYMAAQVHMPWPGRVP